MIESVVLSRCDRLGDLILSLPTFGFLRDAGLQNIILHCSPYAKDVGEWARFNGLCQELWIAGEAPPPGLSSLNRVLSLFHCSQIQKDLRRIKISKSWGPRNKLSCLWTYTHTLAQHRSRVEKTEMEYNLDLARFFLEQNNIPVPEFRGLPALKVPTQWKSSRPSPHTVVVLSNSASAQNWSLEQYLNYARSIFASTGNSLDFLVSGADAQHRKLGLIQSGLLDQGMGLVEEFSSVAELISYLAHAKFVVSSSTGPLHLAHAAGVNVFGVYPSHSRVQSFDRWRPYGYWHSGSVRYQLL